MGTPGMNRGKRWTPSDAAMSDSHAERPVWLDHPREAKESGALPLKPPTRSGRPYEAKR